MPDRTRQDGPVTAFVLSGGGNRGVAQVGMLRALLERGIVPDVVIGTSAGALNGAAIATSPTLEKVDRLESVWVGLKGDQIYPGDANLAETKKRYKEAIKTLSGGKYVDPDGDE